MSQLECHWTTVAEPASEANCQALPLWWRHRTDCEESRGSSEQACCSGDPGAWRELAYLQPGEGTGNYILRN